MEQAVPSYAGINAPQLTMNFNCDLRVLNIGGDRVGYDEYPCFN